MGEETISLVEAILASYFVSNLVDNLGKEGSLVGLRDSDVLAVLEGDRGDLQEAVVLGAALHRSGTQVDLCEEGVQFVVDVLVVVALQNARLVLVISSLLLA